MAQEEQSILLSSGGRQAGALWNTLPETPTDWWPDGHFRIATQTRIGAIVLVTRAPGEAPGLQISVAGVGDDNAHRASMLWTEHHTEPPLVAPQHRWDIFSF